MSKKIKLVIDKVEYQLPVKAYVAKPTYGGTPYIHMSAKHSASIIKQFVKRFFPDIKVWSKSQTYSGGSSVDVSLSNLDGSEIHQSDFEQISEFSNKFKAGSFNGMEDIYEYNNNDVLTDNGTKLDYFPSYVFCKNAPEWGTIEYWVNEYNEFKFMTPEHPNYDTYIVAVEKAGGWLSMNKTYMTDKEFNNVKSQLNII